MDILAGQNLHGETSLLSPVQTRSSTNGNPPNDAFKFRNPSDSAMLRFSQSCFFASAGCSLFRFSFAILTTLDLVCSFSKAT
jgi:hypothetical protein